MLVRCSTEQTAIFWYTTRSDISGRPIGSIFKGPEIQEESKESNERFET